LHISTTGKYIGTWTLYTLQLNNSIFLIR